VSQPTPLRAAELPGPDTAVWSLGDEVLLRLRSDSVCESPNIEEVHPGLFRVQLLQPETIGSLRSVLVEARDWHRQRGQRLSPPNSMHQAGFKVEDVGLDAWVDWFVERVLSDIAQELFPEAMLSPPTGVHAFLVDYGDGADRDLSQHVDDSQVTVNLWLGGDSEGAEVRFEGLRCVRHLDLSLVAEDLFAWRGRPGEALIHLGLHRHRTLPILSGERQSLIFWLQHSEVRQRWLHPQGQDCASPCAYRSDKRL
jgi:hypothetical protein